MVNRPSLAVWKFASCDGCQLTLLDCEDELLAVADAVDIAYFLEATRATTAGPYDVSLVEGRDAGSVLLGDLLTGYPGVGANGAGQGAETFGTLLRFQWQLAL